MSQSNPFRSRPPDPLFDQYPDFHRAAPIIHVEEEFVPFDISKLSKFPLPKQSTRRRHTLPTDSPFRVNPFFKSTTTTTDSGEIADDEYDDDEEEEDDDDGNEEDHEQRHDYDSNLFSNDRKRRRRRRINSQSSFENKFSDLSLTNGHRQTQEQSQSNSSKFTTPSPTSVSYTGDVSSNNLMDCLKTNQQESSTNSVLSPGTLRRTKRLAADEWEKSRLLNFACTTNCNINPPRRTLSAKAALQTAFRNTNTNDRDAS